MSYTTELYLEHILAQDSCLLHGDNYRDDCEICQDLLDSLIAAADEIETLTPPYVPYYEDTLVIIH